MRVHVDTIGTDGFDFDEPIDEEWLAEALGDESPYRAVGSGHLKVHLERKRASVVQARGHLNVAVKVDCSRCLYPVEIGFTHTLDVVLFPAGSEPSAGNDGELDGADVGVATYDDGVVDLSALVRDEIFLEMPMTPTCESADPRDCEHFMANLGPLEKELEVGEPVPDEKPVDPRWAALKNLKAD